MESILGLIEKPEQNLVIAIVNDRLVLKESSGEEDFSNLEILRNRNSRIGSDEVFGDGVFDFRYGPVTSGFIESGSYHIYTYGERMLAVNIDLSTKHRGIERSCAGLPVSDVVRKAENICGNFAFSHSVAYSRAVENALGIKPNEMTKKVRIIGLELERIYNHLFVAARLAGSAAQKVLNAHLLYLFEEALRVNQLLSGSRNLKNFNSIGKVRPLPNREAIGIARYQLLRISNKLADLYERSLESENFMDRLHETTTLSADKAVEIGVTGPSLRASGVEFDLRKSDPDYLELGVYRDTPVVKMEHGDSLARYEVRCLEAMESAKMAANLLESLDESGASAVETEIEIPLSFGVSVGACESPTGVIVNYVEIENGTVKEFYASTPSLFGFAAMRETMVGQIFTDFPFGMDSYGVSFADAAR